MLKRSDLKQYQLKAIDFIKNKKKCGLFLDMGLGKTTSTLSAIDDLFYDFAITKVLVIAPLRVAEEVWKQEGAKWEHLKHLTFSIITGNVKNRQSALEQEADIYVINRENVLWLVDYYKSKIKKFDMLVIDESTSFKNPSSKRFKYLKRVLKYFKYRVILTGTPTPNGYLDLFAQTYILDDGERFGSSITRYKRTYFDSDFMGYSFTIKPSSIPKIQNKIKDLVLYMDSNDYITLPDRIYNTLKTPFPKELKSQYKELKDELILALEKEKEAYVEINVTSASALSTKLLQFSSGAIYDEEGNTHKIHKVKLNTLDELIELNPNDNILVAYNFKFEKEMILDHYKFAETFDKKGNTVERWNNGEIKMLLAHPASAGHGLNLQHGGSMIVWFGFTWNLEYYQQLNKRLHRTGQKNTVRIFHIPLGDIEYNLMSRLSDKDVTQKNLLEVLK